MTNKDRIKKSKINLLTEFSMSNKGNYGGDIEIKIVGRNTNGKLVEVTINADMYYTRIIAGKCKNAVMSHHNRLITSANYAKNSFFKEVQ